MLREAARIASGPPRVPPWYDVVKSYGTGSTTARAESSEANSSSRPPKFSGKLVGQSGRFMGSGSRDTKSPVRSHRALSSRTRLLGVPGHGRPGHAPAFGAREAGRAIHGLREFGAAIEHVALHLLHGERLLQVLRSEVRV